MSQSDRLIETSKFLSYVLRHKPEAIGIKLDSEGWANVADLIDAAGRHGRVLDLSLINETVATSDKGRFALSPDSQAIRANQGHSTNSVAIAFAQRTPPQLLYHGTVERFMPSIRREGLKPGRRHHVHLSTDMTTANAVGRRRGEPVVLAIRAGEMHEAGFEFHLSDNGVWLVDHVPSDYIEDTTSFSESLE